MMMTNDNGINREMTEEEIESLESNRKQIAKETVELAQADADRQALKAATLAKLGLTADEVAALLS